eukprot:TRINITY_DN9806_c0_g1_i2.p1 TRINITY_DN9806_c0_g1~~TRINITY_DN9806_c0_g1_i2.p1  ORF type:complete len:337 (+),score=69.71 TRINITY_DN9806_c0_g1_i2:66-1013(+)
MRRQGESPPCVPFAPLAVQHPPPQQSPPRRLRPAAVRRAAVPQQGRQHQGGGTAWAALRPGCATAVPRHGELRPSAAAESALGEPPPAPAPAPAPAPDSARAAAAPRAHQSSATVLIHGRPARPRRASAAGVPAARRPPSPPAGVAGLHLVVDRLGNENEVLRGELRRMQRALHGAGLAACTTAAPPSPPPTPPPAPPPPPAAAPAPRVLPIPDPGRLASRYAEVALFEMYKLHRDLGAYAAAPTSNGVADADQSSCCSATQPPSESPPVSAEGDRWGELLAYCPHGRRCADPTCPLLHVRRGTADAALLRGAPH